MTTKTTIANQTFIALGELVVTDVTTDTSKRATTIMAIYDEKLEYLLRKYEWKFATKREQLTVLEYYLDVDGITAAPVRGEIISGATGEGIIAHFEYTNDAETTARLYLITVTTGFVDDEALTGDIAFVGTANGTEEEAEPLNEFSYMYALPDDYVKLIELYPTYLKYRIEQNLIYCDESQSLDIKYTYLVTDPNQYDAHFTECFSALLARESAIQITDSLRKHTKMDELFEDKISDARFSGSIEDDVSKLEDVSEDSWEQARY